MKDISGNHWYIATHKGACPIPEGFHSVTPYLHSRGAAQLIAFLKKAFDADEIMQALPPDGTVKHASVRIGDSDRDGRGPRRVSAHAHGDLHVRERCGRLVPTHTGGGRHVAVGPADQPYGDRNAGVADPFGTQWYVATHVKDMPL